MENFKQINNMPKTGFCITQHPLEVGAGMSQEHLKVVKEEFPRNSITFIPFEKIIDNDITAKEAGMYFREQNIDILVAIQSSWSNDYHIVDILEYVAVPIVLWAVPGMENGSIVSDNPRAPCMAVPVRGSCFTTRHVPGKHHESLKPVMGYIAPPTLEETVL